MGIFDQAYAQSATTGLLSVISNMPRPASGTSRYKVSLSIKNGRGQSEDPDNGKVFFRVTTPAGAEFGGGTRFYDANTGGNPLGDSVDSVFDHATYFWVVQDANVRAGIYEAFLQLDTGDTEGPIIIEAAWYEQGRSQSTQIVSRVGDAADMDTVAADIVTIDGVVDTVNTNLGSPVGASISADIASVQTEVDKIGTPVSTVSADIASVQTEVDKIGTPVTSVSADIAAVKSVADAIEVDTQAIEVDTQDLQAKIGTPSAGTVASNIEALDTLIGTPAGADVSADIAAVKAQTQAIETDTQAIEVDTQDIQSKIGTPVTSVSADIAAVKTVADAIEVDTQDIQTKIGTPAGASVSADIASLDTKLGTPAGASVSADIATMDGIVDSIYSAVQGIQNNTKLAAAVPQPIQNPSSGTKAYRVAVSLYDVDGAMEDPDENEICVRVLQTDGTFDLFSRLYKEVGFSNNLDPPTDDVVFDDALGWRAMEREGVGRYFFFYKASAADTVESLNFVFGWQETDVAAYQTRVTEVVDLVDNADAVWDEALAGHSTAGTTGKALADIETDVTEILADTTVIGSPAGASIAADIAAVKAQTDAIETDTQAIEVDTQDIQSKIGTPVTSVSADIAALQADVGNFSAETNLQSLLAYLGGHFDDIDAPLADYLNALAEVFEVAVVGVVTIHSDLTVEPSNGDEYLGATSGTTYTWQSTFQTADGQETAGFWIYSGGTGPQAETLNRQTGSGDATITVQLVVGGLKLQAHTNGATPAAVDNHYNSRDFSILNGARRLQTCHGFRYDGTSAVIGYAEPTSLFPTPPAVGDTVAFWRGQAGNLYCDSSEEPGNAGSTIMGVLKRLLEVVINYQSGDTLPDLRNKIGDGSNGNSLFTVIGQLSDAASADTIKGLIGNDADGPSADTVMGLLGDPTDAAVDAPSEGSIFARLRQILDEIAAVAAGSGTQRTSFTAYPWQGSGVLSAHPTQKTEDLGFQEDNTSYVVHHKKTISLPEGTNATINSVILHLKWSTHNDNNGGGGNGDCKWMISPADVTETEGAAPSVSAANITSEFTTSTATETREVSGNLGALIDPVAATGGFHLLYCTKQDATGDTTYAEIYDESACEIEYEV